MTTNRKKLHKHGERERDNNRVGQDSGEAPLNLLPGPRNPIGVDEAVDMFIEKVRRIEYVDEVRCYQRGGCHEVWTIITTPRGKSELAYPIYDAQWDIWGRMDEETLDFRVVNTIYYEDPSNIAQGSALLWKRHNAK